MVLRMGTWGNRASLRNALCLFWLLALILAPILLSQLLYATLN